MLLSLRPGNTLVSAGKAVLKIKTNPSATVYIDGVKKGRSPLEIEVNAGKEFELMVIKDGYANVTEMITLKTGEVKNKSLTLATKRGPLTINSTPQGAVVFMDNQPVLNAEGQPQKTPFDLRPIYGPHSLTAKLNTYYPQEKQISIVSDQRQIVDFTLLPKPGRIRVLVNEQLREADIYADGKRIGSMEGDVYKTFKIEANHYTQIQAKTGPFESEKVGVSLEPEEEQRVELTEVIRNGSPRQPSGASSDLFGIVFVSGRRSLDFNSNTHLTANTSGIRYQSAKRDAGVITDYGSITLLQGDATFQRGSGKSSKSFDYSDGKNIYVVQSAQASIVQLHYTNEMGHGFYGRLGAERATWTFFTSVGDKALNIYSGIADFGYQFGGTDSAVFGGLGVGLLLNDASSSLGMTQASYFEITLGLQW